MGRVLVGEHPVLWCVLLNVLLFGLLGQLVWEVSRRSGLDRVESFLFATVVALGGNGLWFVVSGMETIALATTVTAILLAWHTHPERRRIGIGFLCVGIVVLIGIRPEAAILVIVMAMTSRPAHRSRAEGLAVVGVATATLALLAGANFWSTRSWLPVTFLARRWAFAGETWDIGNAIRFFHGTLSSAARWQLGSRHIAVQLALGAFLAAGVLRILQCRCARHRPFVSLAASPTVLHSLLAFAMAHMIFYAAVLPVRGHGGRYQPLSPLLLLPLAGLGLLATARFVANRWFPRQGQLPNLANGIVLLVCLVGAAASTHRWVRISASGIAHIQRVHTATGRWIAENVPASATVASFDIGAVSYAAHRPILDLGGLVDPTLVQALTDYKASQYLRFNHVDVIVLPVAPRSVPPAWNYAVRLGLSNPATVRLLVVQEFSTPLDDWVEAAVATGHAAPVLIVAVPEWPER